MDALAPATTFQNATSELVDDLDFTVLHQIVLVTLIQHRCFQRHLQLVHQIALHFVVQIFDTELLLDFFDAGLGGHDNSFRFFDVIVHSPHQRAHDGSKLVIQSCGVGNATRDDERRAGFIDKDRVDFVDDGIEVSALHFVSHDTSHVVAQIIEPELVVSAIGDIAGVVDTFFSW